MKTSMTKIIHDLSVELCRRVGANFPPPPGKQIGPTDYEWTEAEEESYEAWLIEYLLKIPMFRRLGKRYVKKEAEWFMFNYGWKIRKGEE